MEVTQMGSRYENFGFQFPNMVVRRQPLACDLKQIMAGCRSQLAAHVGKGTQRVGGSSFLHSPMGFFLQ